MSTLKEKAAKGLLWGSVSNGLQQLLNLVIGIFLARRLSQSDYGMIGMITIFVALGASVLLEGLDPFRKVVSSPPSTSERTPPTTTTTLSSGPVWGWVSCSICCFSHAPH